ncbi:hypothetical protein BRADI_3g18762v3 [Brachypodium distachyon]|uniref:Uncharacterized protein n=1 Tax=Brachypodium distachyon TaxID=15368 RepID=A0A2K2CY37_BRADI|nr:hypothetical protein BRADI_3g18762v3 [Brachypodium distachyon]
MVQHMIDHGVGVPSDVKTFAQRQFQLRKKKQGGIRRIVAMLQKLKKEELCLDQSYIVLSIPTRKESLWMPILQERCSNNGDSQTGQRKTTKRRRTSNPTTRKSSSKKDSQANASMENALVTLEYFDIVVDLGCFCW